MSVDGTCLRKPGRRLNLGHRAEPDGLRIHLHACSKVGSETDTRVA